MAASTSKFVAGHYTAAYTAQTVANNPANNLDLGTTETGFTMRYANYSEDIRIDDYGDTIVDGIFRGFNCYVGFELVKWVANITELIQPHYADAIDANFGDLGGFIGQDWQTLGGKLVLTPVAGINANLKTFIFHICRPEADHGAWTFNTRLRRVRCNFLVMPTINSSGVKTRLFTTT